MHHHRIILDKWKLVRAKQLQFGLQHNSQNSKHTIESFTMINLKLVALVMGAARGIGRGIGVDLAKYGYAGTYGPLAH